MGQVTLRSRYRGKEILSLLRNHGQLSAQLLVKMLEPRMSGRKLERALNRLLAKGLIERRRVRHGYTYYFLSQAPVIRTACAELLGCKPDDLIQPLLKRKDWYHQELCEYWIFLLKRLFPDAEVVRDREISSHETASNIFFGTDNGFDLFPDFLLIFPALGNEDPVEIAVEIERTRKSNQRLVRKLKAYGAETRVSGLLYVCDSGRLADTIRLLYESKVEKSAIRCRPYGEFYFLFSDAIDAVDNPLDRIFDARGRPVSLKDWIIPMRQMRWTLRRNHMFAGGGNHTPSIRA